MHSGRKCSINTESWEECPRIRVLSLSASRIHSGYQMLYHNPKDQRVAIYRSIKYGQYENDKKFINNEYILKTEKYMHAYVQNCMQPFLELNVFHVKLLSNTELYHWQAFCWTLCHRCSSEALRLRGPLRATIRIWTAASGSQWENPWGDLWFGIKF